MKQSYTVILDWMLDLELSTGELLAYAVIFGFSQDQESEFSGSRAYLARKMNVKSRTTVDTALQGLIGRGLIQKTAHVVNGITYFSYKAIVPATADCTPYSNDGQGDNEIGQGGAQTLGTKIKKEKKDISPMDIAREELAEDGFSEEFYADVATLVGEAKWCKKSANAFHLSFRKLHGRPEAEAHEMVRRAIAGGWQGLFELSPRDRAAILNASQPYQQPRYQQGQSRPAAAPFKSGVAASEALVQAAMSEYNSL